MTRIKNLYINRKFTFVLVVLALFLDVLCFLSRAYLFDYLVYSMSPPGEFALIFINIFILISIAKNYKKMFPALNFAILFVELLIPFYYFIIVLLPKVVTQITYQEMNTYVFEYFIYIIFFSFFVISVFYISNNPHKKNFLNIIIGVCLAFNVYVVAAIFADDVLEIIEYCPPSCTFEQFLDVFLQQSFFICSHLIGLLTINIVVSLQTLYCLDK